MACDEGSKNGHSYNSSPDPFHCSTKMKEKKKKISSSSLDLISKATAFSKVSPGKMSERDPSGGEGNYRLTHDLQQQQQEPPNSDGMQDGITFGNTPLWLPKKMSDGYLRGLYV